MKRGEGNPFTEKDHDDDGEHRDDGPELLEPVRRPLRVLRVRRRAVDTRRWLYGPSTDSRSPVERWQQERERRAQWWRCSRGDGRSRAGRSELCANHLEAHRRELAARRQAALRRRRGARPRPTHEG
jgi:hypothetical protein